MLLCAYVNTNLYPFERDGSLQSVCPLNRPATIQRDALELSKSRSAVLNPSIQQASFSSTVAVLHAWYLHDCDSDSERSKIPSKTAGTSVYQNPNIYTPEVSSQWALSNDHHWSLQTPLMRKLLAFLIFLIQTSIEWKLKAAGTRTN